MNINQAVILAGGRGSRLKPLTNDIPKPMAPIDEVPFLDYLINSLQLVGISKVLILLGYKGEIIQNRYMNIKNMSIEFSRGSEEERTGRRVLNAIDQLDDYFLLMYGDNYWPIELKNMCSKYDALGTGMTTTVFSNRNGTGEYGFENNIVVNNNSIVLGYDKKRSTESANGVDIGYFLINREKLDSNMKGNVSFEMDILPPIILKNELGAYITNEQYYYITNYQSLKDFETAAKINQFLPLNKLFFNNE